MCEGRVDPPSRIPGASPSASCGRAWLCLEFAGVCLAIRTQEISQDKQINEEKEVDQTMPHAQHMQGQHALFDQQVCECEGGGLWVVLVMT